MAAPYTILLIDHDPESEELVQGLKEEGCAVVTRGDAIGGLGRLEQGRLDGVVVNPALFPGKRCEDLVEEIRRNARTSPAILFLTATGSLQNCRACPLIALGGLDCVDTPAIPSEILPRLRWLLCHGTAKPGPGVGGGGRSDRTTAYCLLPTAYCSRSPLSPREQEVLRLLRGGIGNREIAARLFIAEKVVEKHISHLCRKLGVANRTEAVGLSYRRALFMPRRRS